FHRCLVAFDFNEILVLPCLIADLFVPLRNLHLGNRLAYFGYFQFNWHSTTRRLEPARLLEVIRRLPRRKGGSFSQRLRQNLFLLDLVAAGAAGGGAGGALAADAGEGEAIEQLLAEMNFQEPPGAHVLGLFLDPEDRRAGRIIG